MAVMAGISFLSVLSLCAAVAVLPAFDSESKPEARAFTSYTGPIAINENGRLEIFGIGQNDHVWDNWQTSPTGHWHGWNDLGEPDSKPGLAVTRNLNGTLEIFVIGGDNNIWHNRQSVPNGYWRGWRSLGGPGLTSVSAMVNADGRLQVFALGTNATLWSTWQTASNGDWNAWTDLGGLGTRSGFVAGQNTDGRLELFAVQGDGKVWHQWQVNANGDWSDWTSLGGDGMHPRLAQVRNAEGCLELFGVRDGRIWRNVQIIPGSEHWSGWSDLAGPSLQPGFVVGINADRHLEIFGVGKNGNVWHRPQIDDDHWGEWGDLGAPGSDPQLAVGNYADGRLQVFALGQNGDVWSNWQLLRGRGWNGWNDLGGHGTKFFPGQTSRQLPQYVSSLWQTGDGLPGNAVTALLQTPDGYLWVGTEKGLARFDGQRFVKLDSIYPEFPVQRVTALGATQNGELWIGLENDGLFCLKNGRLQRYQKSDGLIDPRIKTICPAANGVVWIGTAGGLSRFDHGKFQNDALTDGLLNQDFRAMLEGRDGRMWIATARGLNTISNQFISTVYTNFNEHSSKERSAAAATALCRDDADGLWLGTSDGLIHRRDGDFRDHFRSANFGLADNSITALYRDRPGALWIGTSVGLNYWREGNACITLLDNDGSGFDQINAICEDFEGNIWAGGKEGLRRLKPKVLTTYGQQAGFIHNNIMSVREDAGHALWLGIRGGGLNRFKEGNIITYASGPVLKTDLILSTCESRDGSMWFGADHGFGLYHLQDNMLEHDDALISAPDAAVRIIYEDRQNNLWLGNGRELTVRRAGKFTSYTTRDGLAGDIVQAILQDRQGNLWFGTTSGLSRWRDGKFTSLTTQQGISGNAINALFEDAEGTLWIGTAGAGLNRFRDGKFRAYTAAQGLFSDDVLEIVEDNQGDLWLSSFNGIFRVHRQSLDDFDHGKITTIPCASYGKADGLASLQCNGAAKPAGWKDQKGKLWFPTTKGLVMADPETPINDTRPPVMIEEIVADKRRENLPASDSAQFPLKIKPGRGELEIHYTALSLQEPEKNRFKYKLDGFDHEWVEAGARRVAYYDNLTPGRYQFQVMACNNNGVWNSTGASLSFVFQPHFWQTWPWKICWGAICLFLVAMWARFLTKRKMQTKLEHLEQQHAIERERTRIAQDMHDDVGVRLMQILVLGDLVQRSKAKPQEMEGHLEKMTRATHEVVQSLDGIVWAVNPENDSLERLVGYILEFAEAFLTESSIRYRVETPDSFPDIPLSSETRHNILLVVKESLNNVVKHAGATEVRLRFELRGPVFIIEMNDDGRGFSPETVPTFGNGLKNMQERMKQTGGLLVLASAPGKGTRVRLETPIHL